MFRVEKHVWRTVDGRLVPHGHLDAAFLAFPAGTEMSDEEARRQGLIDLAAGRPARAAAKPGGKAGLTINRIDGKEK